LGDPGEQRSDLYALGVVLFEALTGQVPFDADTPYAIMNKHIHQPVPAVRRLVPDLPEALEQALFQALAKAPSERFASAQEMWTALDATRESLPSITEATRVTLPAPSVAFATPGLPRPSSSRDSDPLATPQVSVTPADRPSRRARHGLVYGLAVALLGLMLVAAGWFYYQDWLAAESTGAQVEQAQTQLSSGEAAVALESFEQVLAREPDNVAALLGRAEANLALGQPDVALKALDEAVVAAPNTPILLVERGRYRLLYTSGPDVHASLRDFNTALAIDPALPEGYLARGWAVLTFEHDANGSLADLHEAVRLAPINAEARRTLGDALYQAGNYPEALEQMQAAIELDGQPDDWVETALIHRAGGDPTAAVGAIDEAIALEPGEPKYVAMRAYLWFEQGQASRAVAESEAALQIDSSNPAALYVRGLAHYELDDFEASLADLDTVLAHEPFEYEWPFLTTDNLREINLDRALALQAWPGHEAEALSAFDASAAAQPEWFAPYYFRGMLLGKQGAIEAARADLQRALELSPDDWRDRVRGQLEALQ
jgi:tetratricopeptide (TPR) repeat protein